MTVRSKFDSYRQALEAGAIARVASHYDLPLTVVRPDRTATVLRRAHLVRELTKIYDTYVWLGMRRLELAHFEEVGFEESLGIVNVTWQPVDARGRVITRVDTTYALRARSGAMKIASVVAHNEETRRMPLVQSGGVPPARP